MAALPHPFLPGNILSLEEVLETFLKEATELEANMSVILGTMILTMKNGSLLNFKKMKILLLNQDNLQLHFITMMNKDFMFLEDGQMIG